MAEELLVPWYILLAVGIPMLGIAVGMGRLKQKVDTLTKADSDSAGTHNALFSKVNKIEKNLYHLMGTLHCNPIE